MLFDIKFIKNTIQLCKTQSRYFQSSDDVFNERYVDILVMYKKRLKCA